MAAIALSDPYLILTRKIGYSVGLESVLRNTLALNKLYVEKAAVSFVDWKDLVQNEFNRKGKEDRSAIEIANFLGALNLIKIIRNELHVLYGLDTLSILRRFFTDDEEKYVNSVKFFLTQLILEADGDIFLNCLASNFDEEDTKRRLESMITIKWEKYKNAFTNPLLQKKIWDIVSIKSQQTGGKQGGPKTPFETNLHANPFAARTAPLDDKFEAKAIVHSSYLKKVLQTRKGWASDLGLINETGLTDLGTALLTSFRQVIMGGKDDDSAYIFLPYETEFAALGLLPSKFGLPALQSWTLISAISSAFCPGCEDANADSKEITDLLYEIFDLYKSGSLYRGSIRHQLPLYIAKPAIAAIFTSNGKSLPQLDNIIKHVTMSPERIINFVNIRGTEGALVFKHKS